MKELLKELGFEHLPMLSEFVEKLGHTIHYSKKDINTKTLELIYDYQIFITQPPTKGMFIPCDEDGNVMRVPNGFGDNEINAGQLESYLSVYQQAVDRVLFEGWELSFNVHGMTMFEKDGFTITIDNDEQLPTTINTGRSLELCETIEQAINAGVKLTPKQ